MRDIVFDYVVETLGDPSGVLVVDETGFVKKSEHSVGVSYASEQPSSTEQHRIVHVSEAVDALSI